MKLQAIKVVKFGGSSLADAEHFTKAVEIVKADKSRRYVVPSAPGRRFSGDGKVTDMLYDCYDKAARGDGDIDTLFAPIAARYNDIIRDLHLNLTLGAEFDRIKGAFVHKAGRDYAASRGEYLNGRIMAACTGFDFIDAADVIFFREDGTFDAERTNTVLGEELKKHEYAVIPGFYGSMPNDTIKTFSRGGSDITGSIVARAADCELYENWTDASGFMMADPRVVPDPLPIDTVTYRELRELSYMGATVLHDEAIFPVRVAGIPINIRNTNRPADKGTMIVPACPDDSPRNVITGIAGKKGFSVVTIEKDMMNAELGFGRKVLQVFETNGISFEHLPSGIDTMSVIVASAAIEGRREKILSEISDAVHPDTVFIDDKLCLVAVVGRNMRNVVGTLARVTTAIAAAGISIRTVDQGSSEMNIILGVREKDFESAINAIYAEFVK